MANMTLRFPLVHLFSSLIFLCFLACTPKAAGPTTGTTTTPPTTTPKPTADANLSPCKKFSDTPNPGDATDNYVIYSQMLKGKDMKGAMKYWRKVYAISPAADGKRPTVYSDGVVFYTQLAKDFPDRKETYGDTILMLYQEARRCYPGNGYMAAIQGFDSYYTYPGSATDDEIYALFKESIEIDGAEKLNYFIILNLF